MKIKPGEYRTLSGERAVVAAVCPEPARCLDDEYALGWIDHDGQWVSYHWSETGRTAGRSTDPWDLVLPPPTLSASVAAAIATADRTETDQGK